MKRRSFLKAVAVAAPAAGLRDFLVARAHAQAPTPPSPAPLHLHLNQEEWFYVMEGEVAFQVGEQRVHLHPGDSVLAPRRVPHTFSSVGPAPARMIIAFSPAGKMEQYFRDAETARQHS